MEVVLLERLCSLKSNDGICQTDASRTSKIILFCFGARILPHAKDVTLFLSSWSEIEAANSNIGKNFASQQTCSLNSMKCVVFIALLWENRSYFVRRNINGIVKCRKQWANNACRIYVKKPLWKHPVEPEDDIKMNL